MRTIDKNTVKFFVNPEKRKVVCVIENSIYDFIDFVNKETEYMVSMFDVDKYEMPDTFVGIATCGEEDEWNEEIGKLIALNKAKNKWGLSFFKRANRFMDNQMKKFERTHDLFNNFGAKLTHNLNRRESRIEEYFAEIDKANA